MRLKNKILLVVLLGLITFFGYLTIIGNPLVLNISSNKITQIQSEKKIGDTINPLENLDFKNGNWKAYLIINESDKKEIIDNFKSGGCFQTNEITILENLKKNLSVKFTGGDMTTVESRLILMKNGKIIFDMGIVLDKNKEGLQSTNYGWLEGNEKVLSSQLKLFRKVHKPFIIL